MEILREFVKDRWRLRLWVRVGHGAWLTLLDEKKPSQPRVVRSWEYPWHETQQAIHDAELWANVGGMIETTKPVIQEEQEAGA